jgi:iron complex outermembrane recepter protein
VAWGGNATLEAKLSDANTLTAALHFRNDKHKERQDGFIRVPASGSPFANRAYAEPQQTTEEETWSVAVEDVQAIGSSVDLILGASYDWTDLKRAEDVNVAVTGTQLATAQIAILPLTYPLNSMEAWNAQGALVWRASDDMTWRASISSRARFPTLFERFSSRFGTALPNPDIEPERATNYEIGGTARFPSAGFGAEGAIFYSDLEDALVQVPVAFPPPVGNVNQTRNAAKGSFYGFEVGATAEPTPALTVGANYTFIHRDFEVPGAVPGFELTGVPEHKLFAYASWRVLDAVTVTPSIDWSSDRYTVTSQPVVTPPATAPALRYYPTGDALLLNLAVEWAINDHVSLLGGGRNLTDELYSLVDGFSEEGRNFYPALRLRN